MSTPPCQLRLRRWCEHFFSLFFPICFAIDRAAPARCLSFGHVSRTNASDRPPGILPCSSERSIGVLITIASSKTSTKQLYRYNCSDNWNLLPCLYFLRVWTSWEVGSTPWARGPGGLITCLPRCDPLAKCMYMNCTMSQCWLNSPESSLSSDIFPELLPKRTALCSHACFIVHELFF